MAYITKIDLARQAKINAGETAKLNGSLELGEALKLNGQLTLAGFDIQDNKQYILVIDSTKIVQKIAIDTLGLGSGTGTGTTTTLAPVFRGEYSASATYAVGDIATYVGSAWIFSAVSSGNGGIPTSNNTNWRLFASAGADGQDGTNNGKSYEIIFKLGLATDPLVTPVGLSNDVTLDDNIPNGWSDNLLSPSQAYPVVLASKRVKTNNVWSAYSEPVIWGRYAKDGSDGIDGIDYQFIYRRYNSEVPPPIPTSSTVNKGDDTYVPDLWSGDQQGVSSDYKWEYMSKRLKVNGVWTDFTQPVLWSRYASDGKDGKDGTNIEYIFKRVTTVAEGDALVAPASQDIDKYLPTGNWTDNPSGVTSSFQFEYVSQRTKLNGQPWGSFSDPVIWAKYSFDGADGVDGKYFEYTYKLTSNSIKPSSPNNPTDRTIDDYFDASAGWTDEPTGVTELLPYEWVSQRVKNSKGQGGSVIETWSDFATPKLWAKYGSDGIDGKDIEYIYKLAKLSTDITVAPQSNPSLDGDIPSGWTNNPSGISPTFPLEYICKRSKVDGVWGTFSNPSLWSKYAADGADGKDGASIEYIYKLSTTDDVLATPRSENADQYIESGSGWTDNPTGVDDIKMYEFVSVRKKVNGTWGSFSTPSLWSKYGETGKDGTDIEFIYKLTASITKPNKPVAGVDYPLESHQLNKFVPTALGWTDDPSSITDDLPYQWVMKRLKENGIWGAWSEPALFGRPGVGIAGKAGPLGDTIERRWGKSTSPTIPPAGLVMTDDNPSQYTITQPNIGVAEYLWEIHGRKDYQNKLIGTWTTPVRVTPQDGKDGKDGEDGGKGDMGPYIIYKGDYNYTNGIYQVKTYYGGADHLEVVKRNGSYYITRLDAGSFSDIDPSLTNDKWNAFTQQFESVATGLLFAEMAYIDNLSVRHLRTSTENSGAYLQINGDDNTLTLYDADRNKAIVLDDNSVVYEWTMTAPLVAAPAGWLPEYGYFPEYGAPDGTGVTLVTGKNIYRMPVKTGPGIKLSDANGTTQLSSSGIDTPYINGYTMECYKITGSVSNFASTTSSYTTTGSLTATGNSTLTNLIYSNIWTVNPANTTQQLKGVTITLDVRTGGTDFYRMSWVNGILVSATKN